MQVLPIGRQSFPEIRNNNLLYVDKTERIFKLITSGSVYFLSRPRRFGKSLLISTLNEIFSGNKDLFKGLWIENADYDWKTFPIVRIDFSAIKAFIPHDLQNGIFFSLKEAASKNEYR